MQITSDINVIETRPLPAPEEVLADPWLRETGVIFEEPDPEGVPMAHVRALPSWEGARELGPAPRLGEHNAEILRR